ncbi:hypothetical protein Lepto7375DRAFT_2400 [Leptolyngbya sp. PCC 7375]|nr:hypothetical protein Lepto7375DRAFT_2400 [Leptolyngbya sp. PCC 7375]
MQFQYPIGEYIAELVEVWADFKEAFIAVCIQPFFM